jgi:uncharacterized membrane protein
MLTLIAQLQIVAVLAISWGLLRLVGFLGVKRLGSWRNAGLGALAIMFLVTSSAHFTDMKYDLAAMVPDSFPGGLWLIYLTGVFEIAGAIGLIIPRTRRLAGIGLILLLIAMFPANVNAALNGVPLGEAPPTPLWLRAPEQLLFITMLWWAALAGYRGETGRQSAREPSRLRNQASREALSS